MSFKTILSVTSPELGNEDLDLAAALCEEAGAHLCVLIIEMAAAPPVGEFAALVSDSWLKERQEDERRLETRRESVSAYFADKGFAADITAEYTESIWADDVIGRRGRYADLTIIGPAVLDTRSLRAKTIEGALFASGKPLLITPSASRITLHPKRVMIAWDARLDTARAIREALDMMAGAEKVSLVLVDPVESERGHGPEPGADAATYLARHGIKVEVERLPSQGHLIAEVLTRHADDICAELLVMGAYGHSRLRESLFGGVTVAMLENPPLPLFMAR